MKRSKEVNLLVLGATAILVGCSPDYQVDVHQKNYSSKADCARDWGDEKVCNSSGGGYIGPRYYWNHSDGHPVVIMPDGSERKMNKSFAATGSKSLAKSTTTISKGFSVGSPQGSSISRGGFGSSAHAMSGGG